MNFSKFKCTPREDRKQYLYRCTLCGEEVWFSILLPQHLEKHERKRDVGPRCGGRWEHIASGYEYDDERARTARAAKQSAPNEGEGPK